MYLSRLELDISRSSTMRALASPNLLHGAIEAALPGPRERELWRIDNLSGRYYLLLLSEKQPDLSQAKKQFGISESGTGWESLDYTPLLERVKNGSIWRFRLTANPTKCGGDPKSETGARGTVHAHSTVQNQEQWLMRQSEKHGFLLGDGQFSSVGQQWFVFQKGCDRQRVTFLAVTYEGILTVTDEELFRQALVSGIGRGKAYGMGLLTVMRLGEAKNG